MVEKRTKRCGRSMEYKMLGVISKKRSSSCRRRRPNISNACYILYSQTFMVPTKTSFCSSCCSVRFYSFSRFSSVSCSLILDSAMYVMEGRFHKIYVSHDVTEGSLEA